MKTRKTLRCYKCGHEQGTNAIYFYECNKKKGGCGRRIETRRCEEVKEE